MKKYVRQRTILNIIKEKEIETQEELAQCLLEEDIDITQATISRDIKELRLVKVLTSNGNYKYANMDSKAKGIDQRLKDIFKTTVLKVDKADNLLVIKTISGAANLCAKAIDSLSLEGVVGTIAGQDTIFVALKSDKFFKSVELEIQELLK